MVDYKKEKGKKEEKEGGKCPYVCICLCVCVCVCVCVCYLEYLCKGNQGNHNSVASGSLEKKL